MNIINKKARFNYELLEKYEAGLSLSGSEAKSLRLKGADLSNSYAKIVSGEMYLVNANIAKPGNLISDLPVILLLDTEAFMGTADLYYTAKQDKSGSAK